MGEKLGKTIIIFTNLFPYDYSEVFLEKELDSLSRYFERIILVPNQIGLVRRQLPSYVEVEERFARKYTLKGVRKLLNRVCSGLRLKNTYQELFRNPSILFKPKCMKKLLFFVSQTHFYYIWLRELLKEDPSLQHAVFYTYWLDVQSHGISLLKQKDFSDLYQISRAHAYDVYIEDYDPPYIPFRSQFISSINRIYTISEHARKRLSEKHPLIQKNLEVSRLGVLEPGFVSSHNSDHSLSIISTSFLVPEKRVELIISSIRILKEQFPEVSISWDHFGDGPLCEKLIDLAGKVLGQRVNWTFHRNVSSEKLYGFYRQQPVDVLVNTSRTEGIPISIMEAQSCGIPVIATNVGAVSEIVNFEVGILLSSDPKPEEIADALKEVITKKNKFLEFRVQAKHNWKKQYDAGHNFEEFAKKVSTKE